MVPAANAPERRTKKAASTKARLMDAALTLFSKNGFDQTTMRDIAKEADMAVGAAYYYFASKEEIVLAFYQDTHEEAAGFNSELKERTRDFRERLEEHLRFRLGQLLPYRAFIGVLARNAADFRHPLSPFSTATKAVRDQAIGFFEELMDGSNAKVAPSLSPHLPRLLWLYQMGLVLYWIHDESEDHADTEALLEATLDVVLKLLQLSRLPPFRSMNRSIVRLVDLVS